jgi:hypothetical protein
MKSFILSLGISVLGGLHAFAGVTIDESAFGRSLGGWTKKDKGFAEYPLSGSTYRTYKPEISGTPNGGLFISIRIDHIRGWLSSDDHAVLEVTVGPKGGISSAQSSIAIQGKSIKSDMILGGNEGSKSLLSTEGAVKVGTDLVADLSSKLLRENIVEAGRVSFPAVLRHNYNRLFQSIQVNGASAFSGAGTSTEAPSSARKAIPVDPEPAKEPVPTSAPSTEEPAPPPEAAPLEVKPFGA